MPQFRKGVTSNPIVLASNLPNLGKLSSLAAKAAKPRSKIPLPGAGLPRIVNFNADQSGCGFWRMIWPAEALMSYQKAVVNTKFQMILDPNFYRGINAIKLQRQCTEIQYQFVKFLREVSNKYKSETGTGFKLLWEVDDLVCPSADIPDYNKCKESFTSPKILDTVKRIVHLCDEMTVVSPRMAEHYRHHLSYDNISVVPNYVPKGWGDRYFNYNDKIANFSKRSKPRVGYSGSATHFDIDNRAGQRDDFWHVIDSIKATVDEFDYVFLGGFPLHLKPLVLQGKIKFVPWTNLNDYPSLLNSLDLDVMIAPLARNSFTESKSNIKMLESSMLGSPCICQDIRCYDDALFKFNTGPEMIDQIKSVIKDYPYAVKRSRDLATKYWLEDHLEEVLLPYTTNWGDPSRKNNKDFLRNNEGQFIVKEPPVYYI